MGKYGTYADDGSVAEEATECILTERKLDPPYDNTVRYSVKGTNKFFRILGSQHHRVTDEMLKEWRNGGEIVPEPESFPLVGGVGSLQTEEKARNKRARESFNESVSGAQGAVSEKSE